MASRLLTSTRVNRRGRREMATSPTRVEEARHRSLGSAEDKNTKIVRSNLRDEILKLKQEQGKNILVGGVDVPSQLMELGLIDEYRFVVMPIIAGEGRRLMEGVSLPEKLELKLVESKPFKSGCVALRYLKQ